MHLSVLASAPDAPALLLDTDPQRSLAWWHRLREADVPNLIEADARELSQPGKHLTEHPMHELKIAIEGPTAAEILATGVMRISVGDPPVSFSYGGETTTVRFYLIPRPREHDGRLIGTLHPDDIYPGYDGIREVGGLSIRIQLEPTPQAVGDNRPKTFMFFYEVTR